MLNLTFLLADLMVIWSLLLALGFVLGYVIGRRGVRASDLKSTEVDNNERRIEKLEENLQASSAKNQALTDELSAIKKRLNTVVGLQPKLVQKDLDQEEEDINNQFDEIAINKTHVSTETISGQPAQDISEEPSKKPRKFEALKSDNLQIIEGIGPKMESVLKENGIEDWTTLSEQKNEDLRKILEQYGNKYKIIDPGSWAEQAGYAAKGSWSQLVRLQKGLDAGRYIGQGETPAKVEKVMIKLGIIKEYKQDDFKVIEGIGPKIAELLIKEGINTWQELAMTELKRLQNILDKAGKRYQLSDPRSWPKQAALAAER